MAASLRNTLDALEKTDANLAKLEELWTKVLLPALPSGPIIDTGSPEAIAYEDAVAQFKEILASLPTIGGYRMPDALPESITEVGQMRFDAMEVGEPFADVAVDEHVYRQ